MIFKVISRKDIPSEEAMLSDRSILYDLFKTLSFDNAVKIECSSWADVKEKKTLIYQLSTKLRKDEKFKLATLTEDLPLSTQQQEAYERAQNKGIFRRVSYLYVWKEPLETSG
jgi:hypothetical protein